MTESELIFGLHAVQAALQHQPEQVQGLWYVAQRGDARMQQVLAAAREQGIALHEVSRKELDQMLEGKRHQGVAARLALPALADEQDLDRLLEHADRPLLLVLDGVTDPHNLGACLRSADGAGVQAVIVPRDRAVGLTATVRKVASGAAETVPLVQVTNLARCLQDLKQRGVWLVGLAGEAEASLYDMDLTGPIALVLGAEGGGLRRLTREACDYLAHLPMRGRVESLNVSVTAGICLYEAVRQRRGA